MYSSLSFVFTAIEPNGCVCQVGIRYKNSYQSVLFKPRDELLYKQLHLQEMLSILRYVCWCLNIKLVIHIHGGM